MGISQAFKVQVILFIYLFFFFRESILFYTDF